MTGTYFETFLVGGMALLVAAALAIAWIMWRERDTRREAIALSLEGIGHEFRFNMFQTVRELRDVTEGLIRTPEDLPRLAHPQLDAVLAEVMATDKRALAAVQATYQNIEGSRRRLRMKISANEDIDDVLTEAKAVAVDGISTLYLWEDHEGRPPAHARSTRSWWVRDWMKAHGFHQDLLPGLALRDAVVENLRQSGMVLTPKPLTLTAHEYYSRLYSRKDDPRGVFGKRREPKPEPVAEPVAPPVEQEAGRSEPETEMQAGEDPIDWAETAAAAAAPVAAHELATDRDAEAAAKVEAEALDPLQEDPVFTPDDAPHRAWDAEADDGEDRDDDDDDPELPTDSASPDEMMMDPFPNEDELRSAERGPNSEPDDPVTKKTAGAAE